MSDIGRAFDKMFGNNDILHPLKRVPEQNRPKHAQSLSGIVPNMTSEQKKFCSFLSLDTYKDEHGNMRRELIALLTQNRGQIEVEELRRPDFSKIERYHQPGVDQPIAGTFPIMGNWQQMHGYAGDGYYRFFWRFSKHSGANECDVSIDKTHSLQKLGARDVISCLYNAAMDMKAGVAEQLSKLHDTLDKQLQEAGEDVFIYELLQNANDYPYGNEDVDAEFRVLRFKDGGGCLLFCHTGAEFTEKNVVALCSASDQDKSDNLSAIGYKGIGFKTVFRYNDRAEVRSGRFGFAFDKTIRKQKDGIPWRTTPSWVYPKVWDGYRVEIRLFPNDRKLLSDDAGSYTKQLKTLFSDERPLLFIPRVRSVKLFLDDWNNPIVRSKDNDKWCMSGQILSDVDASIRESIDAALNDVDHCRIPPKYRHVRRTSVAFACRRDGRRLLPEDNANIYCYLPARDAQWGFRFLVNTDMIPNGPRNDIEYSIEVNKYFARVAGEKLFVWIDSLIRSGQYDYDSIFALIPDFEECVKNRNPKVVEFIREFQAGVESKLTSLQIPSESGELVPISEIVHDTTDIIAKFGVSFWKLLGHGGKIAHESLLNCEDFRVFLNRYKDKLGIREFGFKELSSLCGSMSSSLLGWLSKPENNGDFINFLVEHGQLETFKDVPIFLNDHGELGRADEMFFYDDKARATDKYLGAFHKHIRHLSASTPCIDRLNPDWFMPLDPKKLVCDFLFSQTNKDETLELLRDLNVSRAFFTFIVQYRKVKTIKSFPSRYHSGTYRREVQEERFPKDFLKTLPLVLDDGSVATSSCNDYSIYISVSEEETQRLQSCRWINKNWVKIVSNAYFQEENGDDIHDFLIQNQLVNTWDLKGAFALAEKHKENIHQTMIAENSDLGFYDFLALYVENFGNREIQQFSTLPVLDSEGKLVEKTDKIVFFHSTELIRWLAQDWIKHDAVVVMNEKYASQKDVFSFSTQTFNDKSFGQQFCNTLNTCLNLDTIGKVIAFHKYMEGKRHLLLTFREVKALKDVPRLFYGQDSPKKCTGEVYLPPQNTNIFDGIASGRISQDIQILDARICDSPPMLEYWRGLGCKELNACELLQEEINTYLKKQEEFLENPISCHDFVDEHISFVRHMSDIKIQDNYDKLFEALKEKIRIIDKETGHFEPPKKLALGMLYKPLCECEKFSLPIKYASDEYGALSKETLLALGVREDFSFDYIRFFAQHPTFCRYFWTEYLPKRFIDKTTLPDGLKQQFSAPCLLNKNGEVKEPSELYSQELIDIFGPIPESVSHIPDFKGFHTREREFAQSLGLRDKPYSPDVIEYLLKRDSNKAKAFEWLGSYKTLSAEERARIQSYRESSNALLENGQGELCQIKDLIAIGSSKNDNAKAFSGHPNVLRIRGKIKADVRETAIEHLGITIITDSDLELDFDQSAKQDNLTESLLPRLLVYVACREGDEWKITFDKYVSALKQCSFVRCDTIRYGYADLDMWLDRRRFYREDASRKFYYVGDSQGRQVFQCLAESVRKWLGIEGDIEDLKDVLDSETNLATMIVEKCQCLLDDEAFMMTLKDCDPKLVNEVLSIAHREKIESNFDEPSKESAIIPNETANTQQNEDSPVEVETKQPSKDYTNDEEEQMLRIFGNNLTVEQMNDENRLVCIRLFNSLKAEGYEPKMVEVDFVRDVFINNKTRRASTIETNDGRQIHVISARGGVAYLPPKWWSRISSKDNGKYVVCAVLSHHENGFRYLKSKEDLIQAIGDNLVVIRVHGQTAQDRFNRTKELFSFNPDLSDFQTYALLRMRHGCSIDAAFEENGRLVGMFGDEIVEEDVLDNEDL